MATYYAPPPKDDAERAYSPIMYVIVVLPILFIGVGLGVMVHASGISLPLIGGGGSSGVSADSVANSAEGKLLYPGATNVKQQAAQGSMPEQSNPLKALLGNLSQPDKLTASTTIFNAPDSGPTVVGWYGSYLTGHGWRACGAKVSTMGFSGQIYTRSANEAYFIFATDAGAFASMLSGTQVNTGQTIGMSFYAVSSTDLHLNSC